METAMTSRGAKDSLEGNPGQEKVEARTYEIFRERSGGLSPVSVIVSESKQIFFHLLYDCYRRDTLSFSVLRKESWGVAWSLRVERGRERDRLLVEVYTRGSVKPVWREERFVRFRRSQSSPQLVLNVSYVDLFQICKFGFFPFEESRKVRH